MWQKYNRKFTEKQEARIAELYAGEATQQELAGRFSCCPATIRKVLIRQGAVMQPPGAQHKFTPIGEVVVAYMYEGAGYLQREIAVCLKCSISTVREVLKHQDATVRPTVPRYEPTLGEIQLRTAEIRENWNEEVRKQRAGIRDAPMTVPLVHDLPVAGYSGASES